ncbi:MAG: PTS sugar transporter subunit IIA [Candidatus Hydrogenedentales bacterium]|jgi:mannitol/fructose-specific phosphotransferase system IIA component (Ntr-type)
MNLTKYILKSCIVPEMESDCKADALKELLNLLYEKKRMSGPGPALDQILAREVTESTGIGKGIAVPHARVTGMKGLACAVGRVPEGMDFHAIDRKPVHLIFLICYPPNEQTTYLNFVATVAKLLSDAQNLAQIMNAESVDQILEVLEASSVQFSESSEQPLRKVKTDPAIEQVQDGHAEIILLARMQLYEEMLSSARSGKRRIRERIDHIRELVSPRVIRHYDRVHKVRPPGLVPVEGDTCQGCFMKLPSKFVQQVRQEPGRIHTCPNCSRYIFVV